MNKTNPATDTFEFKQFTIRQDQCAMKVGTDGILLGAWADVKNVKTVLDIGAGTGLIALMIAQRTKEAQIKGIEIDHITCTQAEENFRSSPWSERLSMINQPVQQFAHTATEKFDLILSNPPFFSGGTHSLNQDRNSVRHTVKLPHGDLLQATRQLIQSGGRFCIILPFIEGLRFIEFAEQYKIHCNKTTEVKSTPDKNVERLLLQFENSKKEMVKDTLIIQNENGQYSDAYYNLTNAFYLNM